jgi:putative hydrolase of the HAD superfamily
MRILRRHRLRAAHCVMVEDSLENLHAAKKLGMRTVWVSASSKGAPYVDVKIRDVMQLPGVQNRLA